MTTPEPAASTKTKRAPLKTLIVVLVVFVLSLLVMDALFRVYERLFLIHKLDPTTKEFDLEALGYNDDEEVFSAQAPKGERRILSIGDSYAFAITKPPYTYSGLLEKNLNDSLPGIRTRVLNLGVPGVTFPAYLHVYDFWAERLDHDGVVFNIYLGNDFTDDFIRLIEAAQPLGPKEPTDTTITYGMGTIVPSKYPLRFLDYLYSMYESVKSLKTIKDLRYTTALVFPMDQYLRVMNESSIVYQPGRLKEVLGSYLWLARMLQTAARVERSGKPVTILISPPHFLFSEQLLQAVLAEQGLSREELDPFLPGLVIGDMARRLGFRGRIIDVTECLYAHSAQGEEAYFQTNTHWSVEGNDIVGRLLTDAVLRDWFNATKPAYSDCAMEPDKDPASVARARGLADEVLKALRASGAIDLDS